jgi:hypothetical protein
MKLHPHDTKFRLCSGHSITGTKFKKLLFKKKFFNNKRIPMTPFLAQTLVVLVVLITLIVLLLMGYLFWLQRRDVAESDRQGDAQRQRLSTRRTGGYP